MEPQDRTENGQETQAPQGGTEQGGIRDRVAKVAEQAREKLDGAREKLEGAREGIAAGAASVAEVTRSVAHETRERAGKVVEIVRESEPDAELRATVSTRTESSLDRAGSALQGAAPTIGRATEKAAEKVGQAIRAVAHPLAVVLGTIAGTLGGWWKTASERRFEMPGAEEEACRLHFTSIAVLPAEMTYERARTGYSLGYLARQNPGYSGRGFEEIEPELRAGFIDRPDEYDSLRDFTRWAYER
jgi:hypothetical protein